MDIAKRWQRIARFEERANLFCNVRAALLSSRRTAWYKLAIPAFARDGIADGEHICQPRDRKIAVDNDTPRSVGGCIQPHCRG